VTRHKCHYGDDKFQYEVVYLPKPARKISIHVHPNGAVQVDAPPGTQAPEIKEAVRKRARWVVKHLARIRERQLEILPRRYVSGESHFYLGRRYMLKVINRGDEPQGVKLTRGRLNVITADKSAQNVKHMLRTWYKEHARMTFQRRLHAITPQLFWVNKNTQGIKLLTMKKQWGSCSPTGNIVLNPHLVKAPRDCIDYVILHELCHLQEHNHSPRFYRLLNQHMPEWKSVKTKLDGMSEHFLND
jgi:predicted metal-dependent hydrolase